MGIHHNDSEPGVNDETPAPERVREAVVEVARRLFAERGIHAVSVREIAREVGVSHTLLHLYFGNKDEIVRQVLDRYDADYAKWLAESDDVAETAGRIFRVIGKDPAMTRVVAAALIEGIIPQRIGAEGHAQRALIERMEAEGLVDGDLDPRVLSTAIASMALGWAIGSEWIMQNVGLDEDKGYDVVVDELSILCQRIMRSCMI